MSSAPGPQINFEAAIQRYQNSLRLLADLHLGPGVQARVGASDVVQDTLLEATRDLRQFQGKSEPELYAWLKGILLHNVSRVIEQHVLTQKRSVQREISLTVLKSFHRSSEVFENTLIRQYSDVDNTLDRHEVLRVVADCLAELADDQRQVILMRSIQGKPYGEIAACTGKSEAACRMTWLRAIDQLRVAFQGHHPLQRRMLPKT